MRYRIIYILWMISFGGYAQTGQAVIVNAGDDSTIVHTKIKWYSESIYYEHGVNIYRTEDEGKTWQICNEKPIVKGSQIAPEALSTDDQLRVLTEITNKKRGTELEGLVKLSVLIQSILSEKFALYLGLQFNDTTVERGKTYQYRIMQLMPDRKETLISTTKPIVVDSWEKDSPPSDIVLTADEKEVSFTWKIEENRFFAVNVYRGLTPQGPKEKLNSRPIMVTSSEDEQGNLSLPEAFFVDDNLQSGKNYYYQLSSIDYFGHESALTEEYHVTTIDKTPPPAPKLGKIKGDKSNGLQWKQKKTDDLAGFNIFRSLVTDTVYHKMNSVPIEPNTKNWQISSKTPGSYWYFVEAVDSSGNTSESDQILVTISDEIAPIAPANLKASIQPGEVSLTWSGNQEPDLLGYLVFRALDKGADYSFYPMFVKPQTNTFYKETFADGNKEKYVYKIVALDTSFNQSPFSEEINVQLPDVKAPDAPFIKDVYSLKDFITVEWHSLTVDDLNEYSLYRSENEGEFIKITTLRPELTAYTDKDIKPGGKYRYYLMATDNAGNSSEPSAILSAQTLVKETISIELRGKYHKKQKEIEMKWKVNNPDAIKGFIVYQAVGKEPFKPVTGLAGNMLYNDNQLDVGSNYRYQVRAYDHHGNSFKSENFEIEINE
ncbi:fibronectin type III domain-containing protein [Flexithrix dorotheae]|uniref:fibronectin type III domain-containing protein n=1 Tax=Flexithrix dorotheae TaxID=70993 RepID=UPI0012FB0D9B|nr:hypothetical protein [Flexithrix dorotheae]